MSYLLAIDPGACSGWAFFEDEELVRAGVSPVPDKWPESTEVIIEKPTVYPHSKVPPNDIVTLAFWVGRYMERVAYLDEPILVLPATWKKQVPKPVHHTRMRKVLNEKEECVLKTQEGLMSKTKAENMRDAVALGLWQLKRIR